MFEALVSRTLPIAAALIGLLVFTPSASAIGQGGHNQPTNRLEGAFKIALYWRSQDPQGCYLSPARLAAEIRKKGNLKAGVAPNDNAVHRPGVVFVIRQGTSCNHLRMALRARQGLYVLDTDVGPVRLKGRGGQSLESQIGGRGPLRALTYSTKSFRMGKPDVPDRFDLRCPGKTFPLGGGATSNPPLGVDGETGVLLDDPRDLAAFGAAVTSLLANPSRAEELGRRARERVRDEFLSVRSLTDYLGLIREVLRAPAHSSVSSRSATDSTIRDAR